MNRKRGLGALAVFAAGAVAGAVLEEIFYRRVFGRSDPEPHEPIGTLPGTSQWVTGFDGTRIHVRAYGPSDAPLTVVMAHGALESHVLWHYQVRDLLETGRHRIVAYDARGHGSSGPARGPDRNTPMTEYTLARDLVSVVTQATEGRVLLAGHSMGGMTIQALWQHGELVHIEERVAGTLLVNTAYTADLRGWRGRGSRSERAFERIEDVFQRIPRPPAIVDRFRPGTNDLTLLIGRLAYGKDPSPRHVAASVGMYEATPTDTLAAYIDLARFDALEALRSIHVPTVVLAGTKDAITPYWLSEEIARRVPGAELVTLEDCGHLGPFERREEVSAHLIKLAERVA